MYFNAPGNSDAQGVPAHLETGRRGVNWSELSAKVSILVGLLTAITMVTHFQPKRRRSR